MRRSPALLALLLLVAACTDDTKPARDPDAEIREARSRLATLAQATANASYDAEYRFLQVPSNTVGTIRIRQVPPQYRIDIVSKDAAVFYSLRSGVVSCSAKGAKRTCYLVAKRGQDVPPLFDPGVQRLFRDAVEDLAAHPEAYVVTKVAAPPTATPLSASGTPVMTPTPFPTPTGIPAGECFAVSRTVTTPDPSAEVGFEDGTYCFAESGVATSITVKSGTLTLVAMRGVPPAGAFKPIATVQQLPTPSPTPKKK